MDLVSQPSLPITLFDVSAQGYSLRNARLCAQLCQQSYDDPPTIEDKGTDTQILIREFGDCVAIAFRGSQSVRDFVIDGDCLMVPTRTFGKVHAGFFDAFSSIRQKLLEHPLLQGPRPIFITGHSLGGALAILGAIYSAQLKMPLHSVYTFGQPRVGNAEFKSVYDALNIGPSGMLRERTFRFVNQEDIVPRIPGLLAGYRHCGLRLFFSTFGALELNPTFWAMALSDIFGIAEAWTTRREIVLLTDHPIARYIEELEKLQ